MGISLSFYGEITATNGVIDQSNFDSFRWHGNEQCAGETNVYIVPSDAPPAGIGEPPLPPFAPALCNAIFAATGKRIGNCPFPSGPGLDPDGSARIETCSANDSRIVRYNMPRVLWRTTMARKAGSRELR